MLIKLISSTGIALLMLMNTNSYAMCDTIPERKQNLCSRLGYNSPDCDLQFDKDKKVKGILEITVDEFVSEPNTEPFIPDVRATSVRITTKDAQAAQIYMMLSKLSYEQTNLSFIMGLREPPCAFESCIRKRMIDPDHRGLTEKQLVDFQAVVNHIIYQTGDSAQIKHFQNIYDSSGIPTITCIHPEQGKVTDQIESQLASTLEIPITIEFALPPE